MKNCRHLSSCLQTTVKHCRRGGKEQCVSGETARSWFQNWRYRKNNVGEYYCTTSRFSHQKSKKTKYIIEKGAGQKWQESTESYEFSTKPQTQAPAAHTQDVASMQVVELDGTGRPDLVAQTEPRQTFPTRPRPFPRPYSPSISGFFFPGSFLRHVPDKFLHPFPKPIPSRLT